MKEYEERVKNYKTVKLIAMLMAVVLFVTLYTFILQKSYSYNTLKEAVETDTERSDAIYESISNKLTKEDYTEINDIDDMQTERYKTLQEQLNQLRVYKATRYLYTAKKNEDGTIVYLVDGLKLDAEDFAYPGTPLEEEMIPYIEKALAGEKVYSQKIMDTTWGHIFSACYPVRDKKSGEVIGALCMEIDMEPTYETIAKNNNTAIQIAVIAGVLAIVTIIWVYYSYQEQKRREQEQRRVLAESAAAAEAANKAKSTFLFNMSHDLRTPMNAILGYADLARKHLTEPERLDGYMDNIQISGEKLLSIINSVLEFARIENNETAIEETVVRSGDGLDSCVVMFKNILEEKKQTMTVEKHILYPYIYADAAHTSEICINIIGNAVKYTGEGGTIHCELHQHRMEREGWCEVEIVVEDNGIGISEEFQEHMFDAFSREESATNSGVEGSGLGMGIVKNWWI